MFNLLSLHLLCCLVLQRYKIIYQFPIILCIGPLALLVHRIHGRLCIPTEVFRKSDIDLIRRPGKSQEILLPGDAELAGSPHQAEQVVGGRPGVHFLQFFRQILHLPPGSGSSS